jgi:hypothetical protein
MHTERTCTDLKPSTSKYCPPLTTWSLTFTCFPRSALTSSTGHWISCFPPGDSHSFLGIACVVFSAVSYYKSSVAVVIDTYVHVSRLYIYIYT